MAIIKTAVRLIIENQARYHYRGPVLTLGVPEIYATEAEVDAWLARAGVVAAPRPSPLEITVHPLGRQLGWIAARSFLSALGLGAWTSVDIPGSEHTPDLVHDLNQPFPEHFRNAFGIIFDPGTTEHVFDMKTALTNVTSALSVGGVVIHQVPIYSYNGGYYSMNPILFYDFYRQNGFADITAYVIMWDRYRAYTGGHYYYPYDETLLGPRHALADRDQCRFAPHLLFIARKQQAQSGIRNPIQSYETVLRPLGPSAKLWSRVIRRALGVAYRVLPLPVAFYIEARLGRWANLRRLAAHRRR